MRMFQHRSAPRACPTRPQPVHSRARADHIGHASGYNKIMSEYLFAFQSSTDRAGFLRAPTLESRPDARFVIAGVPWDGATTNRPGARFGPGEIRRASHMLCDGAHPVYG